MGKKRALIRPGEIRLIRTSRMESWPRDRLEDKGGGSDKNSDYEGLEMTGGDTKTVGRRRI